MKRIIVSAGFAACLAIAICLITACNNEDGVSIGGYPNIKKIQNMISGNWEVTTWIDANGSSTKDSGIIYKIEKGNNQENSDEWSDVYLTEEEDGHSSSKIICHFEPILEKEIKKGSTSSKVVAVEIIFKKYNSYESYVITNISKTSMKWQLITDSHIDGEDSMTIEKEGMIFTKR